jgi:Flp pilus assembly protein TadG
VIRRVRLRHHAGSISLELAILLPAFLALALLATLLGRQTVAQTAVDLAAHDAARAASLTRNMTDAKAAARNAAITTLGASSTTCIAVTVEPVGTTDPFAVPVGQAASITISVACTISLADLTVLGLPGQRVLTSVFTSPIDVYRGRT